MGSPEPGARNEGQLEWVVKEDVLKLNIWEGDKIFLKLLNDGIPFFSLKLVYDGTRRPAICRLEWENRSRFRSGFVTEYVPGLKIRLTLPR